jgi:DNA mismatch endonuclease (patch repair protein)
MKHPKFSTTPEVSKRMSHVRLKRGIAETMLAKSLWHSGIRYRCNYKKLPGSPDIAITRYHIAIFVDGEFWHGKDWEKRKTRLKSNRDYWIEKIEENMARDQRNDQKLRILGWEVVRFWEKEIKKDVDACASIIIQMLSESFDCEPE